MTDQKQKVLARIRTALAGSDAEPDTPATDFLHT